MSMLNEKREIRGFVAFVLVFAMLVTVCFSPFSGGTRTAYAENTNEESKTEEITIDANGTNTSTQVGLEEEYTERTINLKDEYGSSENESYEELTDKRELSAKYYQLESKRYAVVLFANPVHYLDNGAYKDIDNSLVLNTDADGKSYYTNKENSFEAFFAASVDSGWSAGISMDGYEMKWKMEGTTEGKSGSASTYLTKDAWSELSNGEQRANMPNISSQVSFVDAMPNTTIDYQLISNTIKENITINSFNGVNTFEQRISLKGLELILKEDGTIVAVDSEDHSKEVFYLPRPFMLDSSLDENYSEDIEVTLTNVKGMSSEGLGEGRSVDALFEGASNTYILTYTLDPEYLKNATYPIIIDPTVQTSLTTSDILDTRINETYHTTNYGYSYLTSTGYGSSSHRNYALFNFDNMPELGSSEMITSAVFYVEKESTSSVSSYVAVHQITQDWDFSTVTWDSFMSSTQTYDPDFDGQHWNPLVEDFRRVGTSSGVEYGWDVTRIVKEWYSGSPQYGLLLTDLGTPYKGWCTANSYGEEPHIEIEYVDYSGVEGYWDYMSAGLDRSGTASVNIFNGNLVYTHTDLATNGNLMPVTISHIFNSTLKDLNDADMLYGKGWRTNYDQRVIDVEIGGTDYYKYIDGDGTAHYFSLDDGEWKDESGLEVELTIVSNVVTITDKKDNKLVFFHVTDDPEPTWYLDYIEDRNGNRQTVGYDVDDRIDQITDGAGRVVLLMRDANDYLYKIREEVADGVYRDTTFTYTSDRLTRITYSDGEHTDFTYDGNGNIDYVTGVDSKKLDFAYLSSEPYRITDVVESNGATDGAEIGFVYGYNRTELTDSEGRTTVYQFNDYGNTVCVIGPDGSAGYAQYGTTATGGDMSKITAASNTQKFGRSLVKNGGMEVTADWTLSGSTYATDQVYLGDRSTKIVKTTQTGTSKTYQEVTLVKGETYTFSGYVKTSGIAGSAGASITVKYYDDAGIKYALTPRIQGTNDWERHTVTFTLPSNSTSNVVEVYGEICNASGTAWFDCFQLEDGPIANRYNIIDNADFDYVTNGIPDKWTRNSNCTSSDIVVTTADSENPEYMSDNRFEFIGSPSQNKYIEQDFDLSGEEGDSYVVGGWAKGNSIPVFGTIKYGIAIRFNYIGYTDEWVLLPFSQDSDVWQYMCGAVVAKHDYSDVYIRVEINYNANAVNFDGLHMFKEEYGSTFTYDSDGNLTKVTDSAQQDEEFEYNANDDLTKYIDPAGNEFDYTYDDNHNMLTATSEEGLVYTYEYDDVNENGNVVASKVGNETNYIRAEVAYDASGNFTDCVTDPFGEVMDYTYDIYKGTLTSVTDPLSNTVSNTYDSNTDQLEGTSMTSGSVTVSNGYDYTDYRLTDVSHNAPTGDVDYTIHYNDLGWNTGVSVETTRLVTNNLEDQTGRLNSVAYGNSQTVSYTYDDFDRLIKIYQDTTDLYSYIYDNSGNIGYMKDHVLGVEYWYEYDSLFRLGRITRKDSAGTKTTTEYTFNSANMMSAFVETVDGTTYTTSYAYDGDGRPDTSTFGTFSKDITYDATLGRVSGYVLKDGANTIYSTSVGYDDGDGTTSADSGRIDSITNGNATNGYETLSYNYDARGYITRVEEDANNYSEYQYDGFGQLKRENYKWGATSYTMIFAYDVGGNITSRIKYAFVAGADPVGTATATYNYTYDTTWQDELATYAGVTLTHDNIGNLTNDGTWDYTWTQGRRLEEITDDTTSAVIASYKYNDNGIRTEKTVDGDTTKFNLVGSQITWQQTGTEDPIYFLYDSGGKLWGLEYTDGETYFYVRNVQGDIIKIVDDNGDIMVEYAYDAWGNPSTPTGSKATTLGVDNPFRYRGYYFDEETGLYYLNQRYYNSEWGRFINADDVMGQTGALLTHNLFAYCQNNPVMYQDSNGQFFMLITGLIGAAVGAIVGGVIAAATGGDVLKGALIGGLAGGLIGVTCGAAAAVVATAGSIGGATALATTGTVAAAYGFGAGATTVMTTAEVAAVKAATAGLSIPSYVKSAGSFMNWVKKAFDSTQTVLNFTQTKQLFDLANKYGVKISAGLNDLAGHPRTPWPMSHFHLGDTLRLHIAVAKETIDWISAYFGH